MITGRMSEAHTAVTVFPHHKYRAFPCEENLWFIAAESAEVYAYVIYEAFFKKGHLTLEKHVNRSRLQTSWLLIFVTIRIILILEAFPLTAEQTRNNIGPPIIEDTL